MSWDLIFRSINILGCVVALILLITAARRQWKTWNDKTQNHWWALAGWVALGCEASIETIVLNVEPGPRTVLQTLVVAFTLRALTIREPLAAEPVIPFKKEETNEA